MVYKQCTVPETKFKKEFAQLQNITYCEGSAKNRVTSSKVQQSHKDKKLGFILNFGFVG